MKETQIQSLGFTYPAMLYESYAEADAAAGRPLAMLDEGNARLVYQCTNPQARPCISAVVAEVTGVPRKTKTILGEDGKPIMVPEEDDDGNVVKDADGNPIMVEKTEWDEKEAAHVERALAESKMTRSQIQPAIDAAIRNLNKGTGLAVDIRYVQRGEGKPKVLPEKHKATARRLLGDAKELRKFSKLYKAWFGKPLPDLVGDEAKQTEQLGWLVREVTLEDDRRRAATGAWNAPAETTGA